MHIVLHFWNYVLTNSRSMSFKSVILMAVFYSVCMCQHLITHFQFFPLQITLRWVTPYTNLYLTDILEKFPRAEWKGQTLLDCVSGQLFKLHSLISSKLSIFLKLLLLWSIKNSQPLDNAVELCRSIYISIFFNKYSRPTISPGFTSVESINNRGPTGCNVLYHLI